MKMALFAAAASLGCLGLAGCGGSGVQGKWCPVGEKGYAIFSGDKVTIDDGTGSGTQTGKFKVEGKLLTATPDDPKLGGHASTLTISDDGKTLSASSDPGSLKFQRCN